MDATPTQRLATLILRQPISDFITERRAQGRSWRVIARDLYKTTDGQIDVTAETLRGWQSAREAA